MRVTCRQCGRVLRARDDARGKKGRCPSCGATFTVPAADEPADAGGEGAGAGAGGASGTQPSKEAAAAAAPSPARQPTCYFDAGAAGPGNEAEVDFIYKGLEKFVRKADRRFQFHRWHRESAPGGAAKPDLGPDDVLISVSVTRPAEYLVALAGNVYDEKSGVRRFGRESRAVSCRVFAALAPWRGAGFGVVGVLMSQSTAPEETLKYAARKIAGQIVPLVTGRILDSRMVRVSIGWGVVGLLPILGFLLGPISIVLALIAFSRVYKRGLLRIKIGCWLGLALGIASLSISFAFLRLLSENPPK